MPQDLKFRCGCGNLHGTLHGASPHSGQHIACYCKDCRAVIAHFQKERRFLDEAGGVALFQTSPTRITFDGGTEALACLRLSPKGVLRWYAACCDTPMFNTVPSAGLPFAALLTGNLASGSAPLGPVKARVNTGAPTGPVPEPNSAFAAFRAIAALMLGLLVAKLRGDHKRSPFFDQQTGKPVAEPRTLTKEQRLAALKAGG